MKIMPVGGNLYMNTNFNAQSFKGVFRRADWERWYYPGQKAEFTNIRYEYYPFTGETEDDIQREITAHKAKQEYLGTDANNETKCYYTIKNPIDKDTFEKTKYRFDDETPQ